MRFSLFTPAFLASLFAIAATQAQKPSRVSQAQDPSKATEDQNPSKAYVDLYYGENCHHKKREPKDKQRVPCNTDPKANECYSGKFKSFRIKRGDAKDAPKGSDGSQSMFIRAGNTTCSSEGFASDQYLLMLMEGICHNFKDYDIGVRPGQVAAYRCAWN